MNKGILILGSAASGKSTLEKELYNYLYNERNKHEFRVNPDYYVEDEESEYYNNPLGAYNYVYKTILPEIIDLNGNFILQNTGANINTLRKILDTPNYQFKIVVVYCNPIIAFLRNFSRERKVPKQVVLENWLKVYSNLEEYIKLVGRDNIYIYETEYTSKEQTYLNNYSSIKEILDNNPGAYHSTFRIYDKEYSKEEIELKTNKLNTIIDKIDNIIPNITEFVKSNDVSKEFIKKELNKWINP